MRTYIRSFEGVRPSVPLILLLLVGLACAKEPPRQNLNQAPAAEASREPGNRITAKTAELRVDVSDVEKSAAAAQAIISESGGYTEALRQSEKVKVSLVGRVPTSQLEKVLEKLAALGSETYRAVGSEDVTEHYFDLEARLKNAVALRDRLRSLLSQAKSVKDILSVETELSRVQAEVESMQGQFDYLKRRADLATIQLSLDQARVLGPLGYAFKGLAWFFTKLFVLR